jgi:hypothetical protein
LEKWLIIVYWYILRNDGRSKVTKAPRREFSSMVKRIKYEEIGLLLIFLGLLLLGCDSLFSTPIGKILENPRDYAGKTVTISGEVTEVFSLVVIKYFTVKDGTGEIVVITEKPLPKAGTKMKVKGTVREAFSLGDKSLVVIIEKSS